MQRHSDQNHFTGAQRDEGWEEWQRREWRGTLECPWNIWDQMHSTVMEHNLLILLSRDETHFKQLGRGGGDEKEKYENDK